MNNIFEKEFCSYQQSINLEKIGFEEDCLAYFDNNNFFRVSSSKSISLMNKVDYMDVYEPNSESIVCVPLLQQAFRFFSKLGYYNDVKKISDENWRFTIEKDSILINGDIYQTHPECVEKCLDKLIEICLEEKKKSEEENKVFQEIKDFLNKNSLFTFETHDDLILEFLKTVN